MDDSGDLTPWMYTAMLTSRGGLLGRAQAGTVESWNRVMSNLDDLSPQDIKSVFENIDSDTARVGEWMDRHANGVWYCFELDAIHEDLNWLLSEWDKDVGVRYENQPHLMRSAVVYHVHNYHYRVHAYRDKVAQLLNACLDLRQDELHLRAEKVLKAIGRNSEHRAIHDLLSALINDERIKEIVERRNTIGHRALVVYESGKGTWHVVTAERAAQEHFSIGGLSQEAQLFVDLDNFHRHESEKLREVTLFLDDFRSKLTNALRQLALMSSA